MHAVLHREHEALRAALLQALEQAPLEQPFPRRGGEHRRGELLRVADEHDAARAVAEGHERRRLGGLRGLVDQDEVEAVVEAVKHRAPA